MPQTAGTRKAVQGVDMGRLRQNRSVVLRCLVWVSKLADRRNPHKPLTATLKQSANRRYRADVP